MAEHPAIAQLPQHLLGHQGFMREPALSQVSVVSLRAGQGGEGHPWVILIKSPVYSSPAGVHAFGQGFFAHLLELHDLTDLPRNNMLERSGRNLFCETLLCKEIVEIGASVRVHRLHLSSAAWRLPDQTMVFTGSS